MRIMLRTEIAKAVKHKRVLRGITQQELAELARVSRKTISDIENFSGNITVDSYEKVMDILGLEAHLK